MRSECRLFVLFVMFATAACWFGRSATANSGLVANSQAQRNGLVRAWFTQAEVDPTRHRVEQAVLAGNQLYVLTTASVLQAIDAETGQSLWVARIGNPDYPSLGPAVSAQHVALINGSTLTVLNRENGLEMMSLDIGGGPGGGPALTDEYVFVPLFTGKVEAYPLEPDDRAPTWYYASTGRVFDAPTSTSESVAWPTDRGYLYVANPDATGVRYRFESTGMVNGAPASSNGSLYATSTNGYLYCLNELSGQQRWRYSTGDLIMRPPVVVADRVYVATEQPALHSVSTSDGELVWHAPDIAQLVGVSAKHVYGMDRYGRLRVLDKASGVDLGSVPTSINTTAVVNDANDRLYLVSNTGLVQCLHEIGADEPTPHRQAAPEGEAAEAGDAAPDAEPVPPVDREPADRPEPVSPFGGPADDESPFGTPSDNPFGGEDGGEEENPFGF